MNAKFVVLLVALMICGFSQSTSTTAPSVVRITAGNGVSGFNEGDSITVVFDQEVQCGEVCSVLLISGARLVTVPIENSMITQKQLVFVPQVVPGETYEIVIPQGAFLSQSNIPFDGWTGSVFSVIDPNDLRLVETYPVEGQYADIDSFMTLIFNKNIEVTDTWTAQIACTDAIMAIPRDSLTVDGRTLVIPYHLPSYDTCNMFMLAGSLKDIAKDALSPDFSISIQTKDTIRPTVSIALTPIESMESASRITDIILTLDDQTDLSLSHEISGGITVRSTEAIEMYTADKITLSNKMIILANAGRFLPGEEVVVDVPAGLFVDSFNNYNLAAHFVFKVTDQTVAPAASNLVNAVLAESGMMQIRFSSQVVIGEGSVTFNCVSCDHTLTVSGADLTVTDGEILTVSYQGLILGEQYVVFVSDDVVYNIYGNGNAASALPQLASVRSAEFPSVLVDQCTPANDTTAVAVNSQVTLVFDQEVTVNTACEVQAVAVDEGVSHTVILMPVQSSTTSASFIFSMMGLQHFTNYKLVVPGECFLNGYGTATPETELYFRTIHASAPTLLSFNLEGTEDVPLDAMMVFTFSQELVLPENAEVMVKPQNQPAIARRISQINGNSFTIYNQLVSERFASHTTYTVYIAEGVICNIDNLCMEALNFFPFVTVTDSTARVLLQQTVPTSGATQVAADSEVVLQFTAPIRLAAGEARDHVIMEEGSPVTGEATITGQEVRLRFPMKSGKTYTYVYDLNMFTSNKGSAVEYDIGSSFSFTVADTEGPEAFSFVVNGMSSAVLHFDESVVTGSAPLFVLNAAGETVLGPISVTIPAPTTVLSVFLNGNELPDACYTFRFTEGFVNDLAGNKSPMFERSFCYDRAAPEVTQHTNPTSVVAPVVLVFSEAVTPAECNVQLEDSQYHVYEVPATSMTPDSATTFHLMPPTGAWESNAQYTLTIPAGCFIDMQGTPMATAKVLSVQTPVVPTLSVHGTACQPTAGSSAFISQIYQQSVVIAFTDPVQMVAGKQVQLVNQAGCVLTTGQPEVNGATVSIPVTDSVCMNGQVSLVAAAGAFVSPNTGAQSSASTLASPTYSFSFVAVRPSIVSATAVYSGGLQIATGASIDIVFDRNITVSPSALQTLGFLGFRDADGNIVQLAAQIHGAVEGKTLRVIVDEPFTHPLTAQIRSVEFYPVSTTQGVIALTGGSDAAFGTIAMDRLFSLPPVVTVLTRVDPVSGETVTGPASMRPMYSITFDQDVSIVSESCAALIMNNGEETITVDASQLQAVSARQYTWRHSLEEQLVPGMTVSVMVDNACFTVTATNTLASGVSGLLTFTTGDDADKPVLVGVMNKIEDKAAASLTLTSMATFLLEFSEDVVVAAGGRLLFLDDVDGTIAVVNKYSQVDERHVAVDISAAPLRSSRVYQLRAEYLVTDVAGNTMEPVNTPFILTTPVGAPHAVENMQAERLANGKVLLRFHAARDPSLETAMSRPTYCHYTVMVMGSAGSSVSFDDVCVNYEAEPVVMVRVLDVDPEEAVELRVIVSNDLVAENNMASLQVEVDEGAVPAIPAAPVLLAIEQQEAPADVELINVITAVFTFSVPSGASYGNPITGYTFYFEQADNSQIVTVETTPDSDRYVVSVVLVNAAVKVAVKANTVGGSSYYSESLVLEELPATTVVPPAVNADSIEVEQIYADTVIVRWTAPVTVEALTGYIVILGEDRLETTATEMTLEGLTAGAQTVSVVAVNVIGESQPVEKAMEVAESISAVITQKVTSAYHAVATFHVSFRDSVVDCALNAGRVIRAVAEVDANHNAVVVFSDLVPRFSYTGLCWAYTLSGSDVSPSVPINFVTDADAPEATLTVALEVASAIEATAEVSIDVPATVACLLVPAAEMPAHRDVMAKGLKQEHRYGAALHFEFHSVPATEVRMFCAAENARGERVAVMAATESVTVPAVRQQLRLVRSSVVNGAKEVSLRPVIELEYDREVKLGEAGEFVIEAMTSGAKIVVERAALAVEGSTLTVKVQEQLEPSTRYTYYMSSELLLPVSESAVLRRVIYGENIFTTTAQTAAPEAELRSTAELPEMDLDLAAVGVVIGFNSDMAVFNKLPLRLDHSGVTEEVPAAQWSVAGSVMAIATYGLLAETEYNIIVPACVVMNTNGICNAEITLPFTTEKDETRPMVLESQPANDQAFVPNDVPLKLFFSEPVTLHDVDMIDLIANGNGQVLTRHNIVVNGREVTIVLPRGFSGGNNNLEIINIELVVKEDAFRDLSDNKSEAFNLKFTAVPQRCGSTYLSARMEDGCVCTNTEDKCICKCGMVNLFNL